MDPEASLKGSDKVLLALCLRFPVETRIGNGEAQDLLQRLGEVVIMWKENLSEISCGDLDNPCLCGGVPCSP